MGRALRKRICRDTRLAPGLTFSSRNGVQMCQCAFPDFFIVLFRENLDGSCNVAHTEKKTKPIFPPPKSIIDPRRMPRHQPENVPAPAARPPATVAAHDRASVHRASTSNRDVFRRDDRGAARDSLEGNRSVAPARADEERSIGGRWSPSSRRRRARSSVAGLGRTRLPRAARGPTVAA